MKSLPLQFPGATVTIIAIPDHLDFVSVERACRHVIDHGVNPYPTAGRIDYHQLMRAGLEAGILENPLPKVKEPR
jgi:hypothetical protein